MKKFLATALLILTPLTSFASSTSLPVASNPYEPPKKSKDYFDLLVNSQEKSDKLMLIYALINNTTPRDLRSTISSVCKPYVKELLSKEDRQKSISQLTDQHRNLINQLSVDIENSCGDTYISMIGTITSTLIDDEQLATAFNFYTSELGKKWIKYRTTFGYTQNDPVEKAFTPSERTSITTLSESPGIKICESFFTDKIDIESAIKDSTDLSFLIIDLLISKYKRMETLDK